MSDLFRHHLLSQLSETDRDDLRERLLADPALFDQLRDQENDWIDAYAAGRLPAPDAALLHQHLANTGQLYRIPVARALAQSRSRSIFPYAFAIAALVVLCFSATLLLQRKAPQLAQNRPPAVTIPLYPGTLRDGSPVPSVPLSPDFQTVLHRTFQDTAPAGTCLVSVRNQNGLELATSSSPCGTGGHLHAVDPLLPPGRYTLFLTAANNELIHTYTFDIAPPIAK